MSQPDSQRDAARFATTEWSVVVAAQQAASPEALATLCQVYWYPVYAFVRRSGFSAHDAQDLTQDFFARMLEKQYLDAADRERGRFRTFLLTAVQRFLANAQRARAAQKRGGGQRILSLDYAVGEQRYCAEPADPLTPERMFERRWALTMLEQVFAKLESEYASRGRGELFRRLSPCLLGGQEAASYEQLGDELKMSAGAVKVAAHRLRARYRDLLRAEVARTVAKEGDVDAELQALIEALGN